ncbi:hypothetical protein MMC26_001164 [Xylographa opegraphella]|nr:hypothetical protein [Xylographa opegraphella]
MRTTLPLLAAGALRLVLAQITVNGNGSIQCPVAAAGKNFCAAASLTSNIIIRCSGTVGQPGNCNDNLAGVPPVGIKDFAPCYQSSPTTGDAACSYNGIAYPDSGPPFNISSGAPISSSSSSPAPSASTTSLTSTSPTPTASSTSSGPTSSFSTTLVTPYVPLGTGAVPIATTTAATNSTSSSAATQSSTLAAFTGTAGKLESEWLMAGLGMVAGAFLLFL